VAAGFLGLGGGGLLPFEKGFGTAYAPNPLIQKSYNQLNRLLSPALQNRKGKRNYGIASGQLSQAFDQARSGLNQSLASRGVQGSGFGLAAGAGLPIQEAMARSQLQQGMRQQHMQSQADARAQAMDFMNQLIQQRMGTRGMSEQISAARRARPSGFQSVLGDISGIAGVLGDLAPFLAAPFTGGASLGLAGLGGGGGAGGGGGGWPGKRPMFGYY
jgi:hypothetical protein